MIPTDLAAVRASLREAWSTPRTAIGTARPIPGSCSPAPAVFPPAADAAGATPREPAAATALGGTAAGSVGRAVPSRGRWTFAGSMAAGVCLVTAACADVRSRAVFPETFSLTANVGHDDNGGWDRQTLGIGFTWRLRPLPVTRAASAAAACRTNPETNHP